MPSSQFLFQLKMDIFIWDIQLAHWRHVKWWMGTRNLRTDQKWMWRLQMTSRPREGGQTRHQVHRLAKSDGESGWEIKPHSPRLQCISSPMCNTSHGLRRGGHTRAKLPSPSLPLQNERNQGQLILVEVSNWSLPSYTLTVSQPIVYFFFFLQICAPVFNKHWLTVSMLLGGTWKIQSEREAKGILFQAWDWFHMRWLDFFLVNCTRKN